MTDVRWGNVHWSKVPKGTKVYDHGQFWSILINRRRHVVCWTGEEAGKAQAFLKTKATIPYKPRAKPTPRVKVVKVPDKNKIGVKAIIDRGYVFDDEYEAMSNLPLTKIRMFDTDGQAEGPWTFELDETHHVLFNDPLCLMGGPRPGAGLVIPVKPSGDSGMRSTCNIKDAIAFFKTRPNGGKDAIEYHKQMAAARRQKEAQKAT